MLYFLLCLIVGVAAVLLVQKADIECQNLDRPQLRSPKPAVLRSAAKREARNEPSPIGQFVRQ
jgi:hypothetical protein